MAFQKKLTNTFNVNDRPNGSEASTKAEAGLRPNLNAAATIRRLSKQILVKWI